MVGTNAEASLADLTELAPRVVERGIARAYRDKRATLREVEDEYIDWTIEMRRQQGARGQQLGVNPSTLHRRREA